MVLSKETYLETFPNGFNSWQETHFEIVSEITRWADDINPPKVVKKTQEEMGRGGLYELANYLTDKFEKSVIGKEWDGDFFDEIEKFLNYELNN